MPSREAETAKWPVNMTLPNGSYRTKAGSTLQLSGLHGGISLVSFDWFEESHACIECHVEPYPQEFAGEYRMVWSCDDCGCGSAALFPKGESHV
jgi:hypothetical protein